MQVCIMLHQAQFLTHTCMQVQFAARSFGVSEDHPGQQSKGYRWPFRVDRPHKLDTGFHITSKFQVMGSLFMGNKPLLHVDHR